MPHSWKQSIFIDSVLAKTLIDKQTNVHVDTISLIGEGWDNLAFLVNDQYIFRFPRRPMGVDFMQNEIEILPYIAKHVSFPFSSPLFIGHPVKEYPAPFAGYRILKGRSLSENVVELIDQTTFAKELASWLRELHAIPVRLNEHHKIEGDQAWRYDINQRSEKVKSSLKQYSDFFMDAGFNNEQLLQALNYFQTFSFEGIAKTSYCHGDLYSKHILVDDSKLSGLIDWGDIHIGNPGTDLSVGFMIFSDETLQTFFESYGIINDISYQVAFFRSFWHPIILLPYCYETKEEALKKWTISALNKALIRVVKFL